MKFKKFLIIVLCIMISISMAGCGNKNTTNAVANSLDKNTAKLENVLNNLEDVSYKNIIIEEISPLSDETFNTISNYSLQKTKWYSVTNSNTNDIVPTKTTNKDKNRRDAKYVSNNSKKVGLTEETINPTNTVKKIGKPNLSNSYLIDNNGTYSYKPKYINNVTENFNRDCLDDYIRKIEIIYGECADCIGCNAECKNEKTILQQNINDCRTLIRKMRDGTISLSDDEISTCNDCLNNLNDCINRLNSTKNNVKSKEKSVNNLKKNFSSMQTDLENAYSKLLDALENRLNCLTECNDCMNCICNTINNTNVDMADALKNRTNTNEIIDYNQEYELEDNNFSQSANNINNNSNKSNYYQNTQNNPYILNENTQNYGTNNSNFGYNKFNGNNMYGYNNGYYNTYPYMPRNIDTYGYINKNIDTYTPYNQNYQNYNSDMVFTDTNAPIPNPFEEPEIKKLKEKFKRKSNTTESNQTQISI